MTTASDNDVRISVRGISKRFARSLRRSYIYGAIDIGRELLGRDPDPNVLRSSEFWALRDVSFDVMRGQSLGIVGANGGGKTTLLRIISGILKPTAGEVFIWGRIAPLLALGAGFKPVLSGRENIFLNMSLLGLPSVDIARKFDEVVDFAELWDAIDAPVGTYSSGMRARLGFSCAIHTDPDILIIDEILSVGDARFRAKCRNRMNELRRNGTTMLIVSHSPISVLTLSDQCLLLRAGRVADIGHPETIMKQYEAHNVEEDQKRNKDRKPGNKQTAKSGFLRISSVVLEGASSHETGFWTSGRPAKIHLVFSAERAMDDVSINLIVSSRANHGENVLFLQTCKDIGWLALEQGTIRVTLRLPAVNLSPGQYSIKLNVSTGELFDVQDIIDGVRVTVKDPGNMSQCRVYQPRDWELQGTRVSRAWENPASAMLEDDMEFE